MIKMNINELIIYIERRFSEDFEGNKIDINNVEFEIEDSDSCRDKYRCSSWFTVNGSYNDLPLKRKMELEAEIERRMQLERKRIEKEVLGK